MTRHGETPDRDSDTLGLNDRALRVVDRIASDAIALGAIVNERPRSEEGARIIDCGVSAPGGLELGRLMAEACLAGLGTVSIVPGDRGVWPGPAVAVATDRPVAACLASQYAGWRISEGKFFAMASGPMRAATDKEAIFQQIGFRERVSDAVGILECSSLPGDDICQSIAAACDVSVSRLSLLAARTASIAGCLQIAARSVETALHKMHEIGFDVSRVASGYGVAPLAPVAKNDMAGIGRTNDSILYGAEVTLWLSGEDADWSEFGPKIPSSASRDYGRPFGEVFKAYDYDFYKVDPLLFSPAVVTLISLKSGKTERFGELRPDLLRQSFEG